MSEDVVLYSTRRGLLPRGIAITSIPGRAPETRSILPIRFTDESAAHVSVWEKAR